MFFADVTQKIRHPASANQRPTDHTPFYHLGNENNDLLFMSCNFFMITAAFIATFTSISYHMCAEINLTSCSYSVLMLPSHLSE